MTRVIPIAFTLTLIGGAIISWMALLPKAPDTASQIRTAHAIVNQARNEHVIRYAPSNNWLILPNVSQAKDRKALFIAKMLPLIAEQNERVLMQRTVASTAPIASPAYNALTHAYGLKSGASRSALLKRVDVIPESLTLAQAALESAWGTSRFAQLGNAHFGERTYNPKTPGITPKHAKGFKVKSFTSTLESIRSFMLTLNRNKAYKSFRARRAQLRAQGQIPTGKDLAVFLKAYSEIGNAYIQRIMITIRTNALDKFDGIQHLDK